MRNKFPTVTLHPIFVEVMPTFDSIKDGELWISHKHRTVNLRCPCGCGVKGGGKVDHRDGLTA